MLANGKELLDMELEPGSLKNKAHADYLRFKGWLNKYHSASRFLSAGNTRFAMSVPGKDSIIHKCAYTGRRDAVLELVGASFSGPSSNMFEVMTYQRGVPIPGEDEVIDIASLDIFANVFGKKDNGYSCILSTKLTPINKLEFQAGEPVVIGKKEFILPATWRKPYQSYILRRVEDYIEEVGIMIPDLDESAIGIDEKTDRCYIMDWGNGITVGLHSVNPDNLMKLY